MPLYHPLLAAELISTLAQNNEETPHGLAPTAAHRDAAHDFASRVDGARATDRDGADCSNGPPNWLPTVTLMLPPVGLSASSGRSAAPVKDD